MTRFLTLIPLCVSVPLCLVCFQNKVNKVQCNLFRGWLRSQPRKNRRQIDRAWVLNTPSQSWIAAGLWIQARTVA